jgi:hypothetical protein
VENLFIFCVCCLCLCFVGRLVLDNTISYTIQSLFRLSGSLSPGFGRFLSARTEDRDWVSSGYCYPPPSCSFTSPTTLESTSVRPLSVSR